MGSKFSCISRHSILQQAQRPAPAMVIGSDGVLKEISPSSRVAVQDVVGGDTASFFLCDSDALYFDHRPPALASGELLRPGQIYFVLPAAMLGRPLSSAEMVMLAVRASAALAVKKTQGRRRRRGGKKNKVRVVPVQPETEDDDLDAVFNEKLNQRTLGEFVASLRPAKSDGKLAASAARSHLKRALSIIREDAE